MTDPTDDTPDLARAVEAVANPRVLDNATHDCAWRILDHDAAQAERAAGQLGYQGVCSTPTAEVLAVWLRERLAAAFAHRPDRATQPTEAALTENDVMEAIRDARVQHEWPAETDDGLDYTRCSCGYRPPYSPGGHADPLVMADHCDGAQAHAVLLLAARTQPTAEPRRSCGCLCHSSPSVKHFAPCCDEMTADLYDVPTAEPRTVETDDDGWTALTEALHSHMGMYELPDSTHTERMAWCPCGWTGRGRDLEQHILTNRRAAVLAAGWTRVPARADDPTRTGA